MSGLELAGSKQIRTPIFINNNDIIMNMLIHTAFHLYPKCGIDKLAKNTES